MTDAYSVLEDAISDGGPPSGFVALRFIQPSLAVFLTEKDAKGLEPDWPESLHDERIHFRYNTKRSRSRRMNGSQPWPRTAFFALSSEVCRN